MRPIHNKQTGGSEYPPTDEGLKRVGHPDYWNLHRVKAARSGALELNDQQKGRRAENGGNRGQREWERTSKAERKRTERRQ